MSTPLNHSPLPYVDAYACVFCQATHTKHFKWYSEHLKYQSKHGIKQIECPVEIAEPDENLKCPHCGESLWKHGGESAACDVTETSIVNFHACNNIERITKERDDALALLAEIKASSENSTCRAYGFTGVSNDLLSRISATSETEVTNG